jgi:hypothetical protein
MAGLEIPFINNEGGPIILVLLRNRLHITRSRLSDVVRKRLYKFFLGYPSSSISRRS